MSSTSKTANLELNQWVSSDQFKMEDFNEDNRKIDAAVGAQPWVKLMDVTVSTNVVKAIELDVSGLDLSKCPCLKLFKFSGNRNGAICLRLNKSTQNYHSYSILSGWQLFGNYCQFSSYVDFDLLDSNLYMHDSTNRMAFQTSFNPTGLSTIDLLNDSTSNTAFPLGTRFVLLGVRV